MKVLVGSVGGSRCVGMKVLPTTPTLSLGSTFIPMKVLLPPTGVGVVGVL